MTDEVPAKKTTEGDAKEARKKRKPLRESFDAARSRVSKTVEPYTRTVDNTVAKTIDGLSGVISPKSRRNKKEGAEPTHAARTIASGLLFGALSIGKAALFLGGTLLLHTVGVALMIAVPAMIAVNWAVANYASYRTFRNGMNHMQDWYAESFPRMHKFLCRKFPRVFKPRPASVNIDAPKTGTSAPEPGNDVPCLVRRRDMPKGRRLEDVTSPQLAFIRASNDDAVPLNRDPGQSKFTRQSGKSVKG